MSPIPLTGCNFEQVDPGTYPARLVRIHDLGTQEESFNGKTTYNRKVLLGFELVDETMEDGRPYMYSLVRTASLHEKSALRRDLETWLGRAITREQEKSFDLHSLLDKPALATIAETETGKRKVAALAGVPKGMSVPPAQNSMEYFSLDPMEFDEDTLARIPQFWQDKIKASPEYRLLMEGRQHLNQRGADALRETVDDEFVDDDEKAPWD